MPIMRQGPPKARPRKLDAVDRQLVIDDGGPAYPSDPQCYGDAAGPGMSIRAAIALHVLPEVYRVHVACGSTEQAAIAQEACELADALIAALKGRA